MLGSIACSTRDELGSLSDFVAPPQTARVLQTPRHLVPRPSGQFHRKKSVRWSSSRGRTTARHCGAQWRLNLLEKGLYASYAIRWRGKKQKSQFLRVPSRTPMLLARAGRDPVSPRVAVTSGSGTSAACTSKPSRAPFRYARASASPVMILSHAFFIGACCIVLTKPVKRFGTETLRVIEGSTFQLQAQRRLAINTPAKAPTAVDPIATIKSGISLSYAARKIVPMRARPARPANDHATTR